MLGVGVDAVNMEGAVQRIIAAASARSGGYVCVTGVHGVMESQRDATLLEIQNRSMLTVPDGMPMVWMGRLQGFSKMKRVYGPDLMLRVCEAGLPLRHRHFFYGGGNGVAEQLSRSLVARYPGLHVAGCATPPFRALSDAELDDVAARLNRDQVEFVWIGLSTPKQERLAARLSALVPRSVFLGVGAAFDMNAGLLAQAPSWMQASGLEWLFRLLAEPRRLWRRYLRNNPEFIVRAALQLLSGQQRPGIGKPHGTVRREGPEQ